MNEKLLEAIAVIIAKQCSMYTETPVEKERCVGAAAQILWLLKEQPK